MVSISTILAAPWLVSEHLGSLVSLPNDLVVLLDDQLILCLEHLSSLITLLIEVCQHAALPIVLALHILNNLLLVLDILLNDSLKHPVNNSSVLLGHGLLDLLEFLLG